MRVPVAAALTLIALMTGWATPARAQGAVVHGSVAAAVSDDTTSPAYGGGVTWRFNSVLGLGLELSHLRSLTSSFAHIYCCTDDGEQTSATTFTTNVRLEIPTTTRRVVPFVVAGGGVAAVRESYGVYYAQLAGTLNPDLVRIGLTTLPVLPGPSTVTTTTTNMALTLGGGASLLVSRRFSVDLDLRALHIMGDPGRTIGRFGGGVSYRF